MKDPIIIKKEFKKVISQCLLLFMIYVFLYAGLFCIIENNFYIAIYSCFFVFNCIVYFTIRKMEFDIILHIIGLYFSVILIFTFASLFFQILTSYHGVLWYIIILANLYAFLEKKQFYKWAIMIFILIVFNIISLEIIIHKGYISKNNLLLLQYPYKTKDFKIFTELFGLTFFCVSGYYAYRFNYYREKLKTAIPTFKNTTNDYRQEEKNATLDNFDYKELFDIIKSEVESKELYLNKTLTLSNLSELLNINIGYISRAINKNSEGNFNDFINSYRIEHFKKLVELNKNDTFKLMYLFDESGFKNQSTFNKAFKKREGLTPTEYIKGFNSEK